MGNLQPQNFDPQASGFFTALPEDIMILLADYISIQDFTHLITTCKYYNHHLFGVNNVLWARLCHSLGGANQVLKDLQFYKRWKVMTGQDQLDLNKEVDLNDKQLLRSIDFKKEIYNYYLIILSNRRLRQRFAQFSMNHLDVAIAHPEITVIPFSFWTNLSQYYMPKHSMGMNYSRDYFYVVNLEYDPVSVEAYLHKENNEHLPSNQSGRLIVYKKSKRQLHTPGRFYSRQETIWPQERAIEDLVNDTNVLEEHVATFREMK